MLKKLEELGFKLSKSYLEKSRLFRQRRYQKFVENFRDFKNIKRTRNIIVTGVLYSNIIYKNKNYYMRIKYNILNFEFGL